MRHHYVVDLIIKEDGESLKEVHEKWRRLAKAKMKILRSYISQGGHSMGSTISKDVPRPVGEN